VGTLIAAAAVGAVAGRVAAGPFEAAGVCGAAANDNRGNNTLAITQNNAIFGR
jgi:hypothetical protein